MWPARTVCRRPPRGCPKAPRTLSVPPDPKGVWDWRGQALPGTRDGAGAQAGPAPPPPPAPLSVFREPAPAGLGKPWLWAQLCSKARAGGWLSGEGTGTAHKAMHRARGPWLGHRPGGPGHLTDPSSGPLLPPRLSCCHLWAGRPWGLQGVDLSSPCTPHLDSLGGGSYRWSGWQGTRAVETTPVRGHWAEYPYLGRVLPPSPSL